MSIATELQEHIGDLDAIGHFNITLDDLNELLGYMEESKFYKCQEWIDKHLVVK